LKEGKKIMLRYELIEKKRPRKPVKDFAPGELFLCCGKIYRVCQIDEKECRSIIYNLSEYFPNTTTTNLHGVHYPEVVTPEDIVLDKNGYIQLKETEKKQVPFCDLKIGDAFSYPDDTGFENIGIKIGWYTHVFGLNGIFNEYKSEYDYIMVTPLSPDEIRIWNE
jgi:hypothetical protein